MAALEQLDGLPGTVQHGFFADRDNGRLYLVIGCEDTEIVHQVAEITAPANLPLKTHGEW